MKTFTIEIWSRGVDVGMGKITKAQYDYWSDEGSMYLGDALNDNFDYEENEAPEGAKLDRAYYNEYDDIFYAWGPDMDYHTLKITDEDGNVIYEGEAYGLIQEHDEDHDFMYDGEEYFSNIQEPGHYVSWCQGGKGLYFEGQFEDEEFDPKKLKFFNSETDYGDVLSGISYGGDDIENNAGDYDIKSFEASVYEISDDAKPYVVFNYEPEYDYEKVDKVLRYLVDNMLYDVDNLEIGENISDDTAVKIIFDGYGDLEEDENGEYVEGGNKNMESYAIFIHKNSADPEFEFPEHDLTPWALIHRPDEEVCVYGWHDVNNDSWDFTMIEDTSTNLSKEVITKLIDDLYESYGLDEEEEENTSGVLTPNAAWPFPNAS
ncbi:hypothetical protein UFOVP257_204 [uncultured Caudovirales phage]|uniref:Uncharacterized protein n=1 Tax=uncultured Caudovirales phage TaxID=2100421 RepID=A0A6J5LGW5_9CAUD|nr:hypothetical protein UFOVP257_204 [uncultured Caudovirales phage]